MFRDALALSGVHEASLAQHLRALSSQGGTWPVAVPLQLIQHTGVNGGSFLRSGVSVSGLRRFIAVVAVLAAAHGLIHGLILIRELSLRREAAPGSY